MKNNNHKNNFYRKEYFVQYHLPSQGIFMCKSKQAQYLNDRKIQNVNIKLKKNRQILDQELGISIR